MKMDKRGMHCYLCGSNKCEEFERVDSFGFPLIYFQCDSCGLIFQLPEANQATDPQFYAQTYRQIYQASVDPTPKDLWVQERRALTLVNLLQTLRVDASQRILDIGASTGLLLKTFRETFGGEVMGVEPGNAYRTHAEKGEIPMFASIEALIETNPPKFTLVSMIHVLEHLPDPLGVLRMIRSELLKESGILLLEVPNFYAHDSYELAHLACYTSHTLQQVLRQAGYHVFFFQRHGFPRSSWLNLYLTLMAQPLPDDVPLPPVKPDRMVRFKREVGLLYRRGVEKIFPNQAWLPLPDFPQS
jgi:2-polyprenyl-3-methyl-5-hydroxy-6-metoxy-1,4-benzoquinol methylase